LLTGYLVDHISYAPVFLMVGFMPLIGTFLLFAIGRAYRLHHAIVAPGKRE
jgi:MFS transporter, ACS family, hexuronate transporter